MMGTMVLTIVAIVVVAVIIIWYLLKGKSTTGFMPQVSGPDQNFPVTAGSVVHWVVSGTSGGAPDSLAVDCEPNNSFVVLPATNAITNPAAPIPVPGSNVNPTQVLFSFQLTAAPADPFTIKVSTSLGSITDTVKIQPVSQSTTPSTQSAAPGANVGWTVTLDRPAGSTGQAVAISTTTPANFSMIPSTLFIAAGHTHISFPTTLSAGASGTAEVTSKCNGGASSGTVHIT